MRQKNIPMGLLDAPAPVFPQPVGPVQL